MTDLLLAYVTVAMVVIYTIQWLKQAPSCPWVTRRHYRTLRFLLIVGAVVGGGVISAGFDALWKAVSWWTVWRHVAWRVVTLAAVIQVLYEMVVASPKAHGPNGPLR